MSSDAASKEWEALAEGRRRWRVKRQDDNGNVFDAVAVTSRCEAEALVRQYEALHHKQMYWVEDADLET